MSATIFLRQQISDFKQRKPVYDSLGAIRQRMSVIGASVHRDATDENTVLVALKFGTLDHARAYASSDDLKAARARGGVVGTPNIWFTEDVEATTH